MSTNIFYKHYQINSTILATFTSYTWAAEDLIIKESQENTIQDKQDQCQQAEQEALHKIQALQKKPCKIYFT